MVGRYNAATGAFAGWIGWISSTAGTTNAAHPLASAPGTSNTCGSASAGSVTPGWCTGGTANGSAGMGSGGINYAAGLAVDSTNTYLYVSMSGNSGTISKYNLQTGAYIGNVVTGGSPLVFNGINGSSFDGTYFYVADSNRLAKVDTNGVLWGWLGKVNTTISLSNASSNSSSTCSTTGVYSNTPGFCMGGSAHHGMDEQSLWSVQATAVDGNGNVITGGDQNYPSLKKWNATTGAYGGMLAQLGNSPNNWTTSQSFAGYQGYDDNSLYTPDGLYNDGTYLYIADMNNSRVKKVSLQTGSTVGWVGGVGGFVNGLTHLVACGLSSIGITTGWCTGAIPSPSFTWGSMAPTTGNGVVNQPMGITGDGTTYLYVTDYSQSRILRFRMDTGAYAGWIGGIANGSPTTGPATVNDSSSCTNANNVFTPGWCLGGVPTSGTGNGYLSNPEAIVYSNGNLYVVDYSNSRVSSYVASSGAFNGWVGRVNSTTGLNPTSVSRGGYTYTNGWSTGGTSQASITGADPGGGFNFSPNLGRTGITSDGTNLYISNQYNSRIDIFNQSTGIWQKSVQVDYQVTSYTWSTTPSSWGWTNKQVIGLVYSGGYLYANYVSSWTPPVVLKINATTGSLVGWMGGISTSPSGPTGSACVGATGVTPSWCIGGSATQGYTLGNSNNVGGFSNNYGITIDSNFVYVSDENLHRIVRYPK